MNQYFARTPRPPSAPQTLDAAGRRRGIPGLAWAILGLLAIIAAALTAVGAAAEQFKVVTAVPEKMSRGTTTFIDGKGAVVWRVRASIPDRDNEFGRGSTKRSAS